MTAVLSMRRAAIWLAAISAAWLVSSPFLGPLLALLVAVAVSLVLVLLSRTAALRRAGRSSRLGAGVCAGLVGGLGQIFQRVLVANPSDNAYLLIALLGSALILPAALFAVAATAPWDSVRVWASRGGVALVYLLGVLGALPVPFIAYSFVSALFSGQAAEMQRNPVAVNHALTGVLSLLMIGLVSHYQPGSTERRPSEP
jgi:hypothetical protein